MKLLQGGFKGKAWKSGTAEPSTWSFDEDYAGINIEGKAGILLYDVFEGYKVISTELVSTEPQRHGHRTKYH